MSQSISSFGRGTSPNTAFTAPKARAWHLPMKPAPISPIPMFFIVPVS